MADKKTETVEQKEDVMYTAKDVSELGRLEETLPEEIFVRKRIGKQLFLVRVHFKKEGTENLHTKICRMLEEEVRNSGYA